MRPVRHDRFDELGGGRSGAGCPGDQPFGVPGQVRPMAFGHVLGAGGVAAFEVAAPVAGYPLAAEEHLDGVLADPRVDPLADQLVGHRVVMPVHLDVVVNIDLGGGPGGELIARWPQRAHRRAIALVEQAPPSTATNNWACHTWASGG